MRKMLYSFVVVVALTLGMMIAPTVVGVATDGEAQVEKPAEAHSSGSCKTSYGDHNHWFGYNRLHHRYEKRVYLHGSTYYYYHSHTWSYTPWYNHTVRTYCSL